MDRKHIRFLLNEYAGKYPLEKEQVDRFKSLLSAKNCFNSDNEFGHITASSLVIDLSKAYGLLTHHRKINKWLQLGGHVDPQDNTIVESAQREAFEESSLDSLILVSESILDIDIHKIYNKDLSFHFHFDIRFLFTADKNEKFVVSNESKDLKWIPLNSFEDYNSEWSLIKMREKIKRHF